MEPIVVECDREDDSLALRRRREVERRILREDRVVAVPEAAEHELGVLTHDHAGDARIQRPPNGLLVSGRSARRASS